MDQMMATPRLADKKVLITGASTGIGLAIASLFRAHGAHLAITGQDPARLAQAQQMLGEDALVLQSDCGKLIDIDDAMEKVRERFGCLDVLIANAGLSLPTPFDQVSESQFDAVVATNFKGVFFNIQKALPLFSRNAAVIVTTSISNQMGSPNFSVYAATKAAQRSLVRTLALELIPRGVRVNAISPGPIDTPRFGQRWKVSSETIRTIRSDLAEKSPMKRFGTPEEVAQVALFLASDEASYLVGEEIVVDGGMSLPLR